jgi:hypothetical protein
MHGQWGPCINIVVDGVTAAMNCHNLFTMHM